MEKDFNVVMAFENGTYCAINNFKASSKREVIKIISNSPNYDVDNIVTITVLDKPTFTLPSERGL